MAKSSDIINAIANKKKLYISYQNGAKRKVEMFVYGKHKDSENDVVRVWEQSGATESNLSGGKENWRLMITKDITILESTDTDVDIKRARANGYNDTDKDIFPIRARYTDAAIGTVGESK